MADIPADYASPSLRHALLIEDEPFAEIEFRETDGHDPVLAKLLPPRLRDKTYCVAVITLPDGRPPMVGYKAVPTHGKLPKVVDPDESDAWDLLCSKALGRALKRGGYPAKLPELKAVVLWRQRNAELAALEAGRAQLELKQADVNAALTAAGSTSEDVDEVGDVDDEVADAEVVENDDRPPTSATQALLRQLVNDLSAANLSSKLTAFARAQKLSVARPRTEGDALKLIEFGTALKAEQIQPAPITSEVVEEIMELVSGLASGDEQNTYETFLASHNLGPDPATWNDDQREAVLVWLQQD